MRFVLMPLKSMGGFEQSSKIFQAVIDAKDGTMIGYDGGEPEDQILSRDWSWVPEALNSVADEVAEQRERADAAEVRVADLERQCAALRKSLREWCVAATDLDGSGPCVECGATVDAHDGHEQPDGECGIYAALSSAAGRGYLSPADVDALLRDLQERCARRADHHHPDEFARILEGVPGGWIDNKRWHDALAIGAAIRALPLRRETGG